jgi:hypothetical protein
MNVFATALILAVAAASLTYGQDSTITPNTEAAQAAITQNSAPAPISVFKPRAAKYDYDAIPRDPLASAIFSATIPGSGQVYNKEYLRGILTAIAFYGGFFHGTVRTDPLAANQHGHHLL